MAYLTRAHPELANDQITVIAEQGREVEDFYLARLTARLGLPVFTVALASQAQRVLETTRALEGALSSGRGGVILQASFIYDGVFVALDALVVSPEGSLTQYELKSSSADPDKDDVDKKSLSLYLDTLIQYRTVSLSGRRVDQVILVRLNKQAISPDWDRFFYEKDITDYCAANLNSLEVIECIRGAKAATLSSDDVACPVGGHCKSPFKCPFFDACHSGLPKDGIHTLYRLMPATRKKLSEAGITTIGEIPKDFKLTGVALKQRTAAAGDAFIDKGALRQGLALKGPIAFLDFETIMTALPKFDGYAPWAQVVIQASVHVTDENGTVLSHHEWLASREAVAAGMVAENAAAFLQTALDGCQTVVSYNQSFELSRMRELASRVPSFTPTLEFATAAMVDLLKVVEAGYYHKNFGGSLSIKKVLPVLVPEMSYAGMEVENGLEAMDSAMKVLFSNISAEEEKATRAALLKYCHLDTLAMVEIYRALRFLADQENPGEI